ncbi:type IV pilus modification PilV family protein [Arsukibacterium indicum]|uniref:Type II secretion system GspH family protein n=1 Tax=Arsukibacterium indicum TaxID=2848612 RepID=A0ABS6MHE2_9GAMM|nr:type II secretion system protein [Arsukibacterium indicum]MBV2127789.1 type II secretion system GspH family protein [Arsukibacterium indicum]
MKHCRGLTLVEVLIAAVILFAALSLSAVTIQTLRQSSAQAGKVIKTLQPARMIALTIQQQIRTNPQDTLSGSGSLENVSFQWQAVVIRTGSAPPRFDAGTVSSGADSIERFRLYQVELQLSFDGRTEQLQFKELAWLPPAF